MRTPRLSDGPSWSQARLANREWLERAFPAWGDDWAAEQSETAWAERWWQLRRTALAGHAMPFVLLLDGRLIGELGVDAIDGLSNGGEGSAWMVRDHGSPVVMNAASVLLIHHSFTASRPIDRMISPTATTARRGRSPGLSAVGMRIEGTVGRKVGDKGFVEHDIWVVHNTAESRARMATLVAELRPGRVDGAARGSRVAMLAPTARAVVRRLKGLSTRSARPTSYRALPAIDGVRLDPVAPPRRLVPRPRPTRGGVPWDMAAERIMLGDTEVGTLWTRADPGTATHDVVAGVDEGIDRAVLCSAIRIALSGVDPGARAAVRVPLDPGGRTVPDEEMLRELGFTLVATFDGNPEGPSGWAGEQRWELVT